MKKKVQPILALPLAALLLVSSGCGGGTGTSAVPSVPDKGASSSRLVSSKADASSGSAGTRHIKKQLDKNLTMDADVILPGKSAYSSYPLVYRTFTSKELTGLFFSGDTGKKASETNTHGLVSVKSSSGAWAVANNDSGIVSFQKSKRDSAIDSIFGEYIVQAKKTNRQVFQTVPTDLPFMTHEEAAEKGSAILRSMKFFGEPILAPKMIAVTGKELDKFQTDLLKDTNYKDFPKTVIIKGWSEKDNCYFIQYSLQKDGIPIYDGGNTEPDIQIHGDIDATIPRGLTERMLITPQGLCYFKASGVYLQKEDPSGPKSILSVDKAVKCLKNKYADVILTNQHTVKKIWLEYIDISDMHNSSDKQEITLLPYWCFQIDSADSDGRVYSHAARFNAFTGKDLEYEE